MGLTIKMVSHTKSILLQLTDKMRYVSNTWTCWEYVHALWCQRSPHSRAYIAYYLRIGVSSNSGDHSYRLAGFIRYLTSDHPPHNSPGCVSPLVRDRGTLSTQTLNKRSFGSSIGCVHMSRCRVKALSLLHSHQALSDTIPSQLPGHIRG